jgi:UDPglucose 6-dehydrogenase
VRIAILGTGHVGLITGTALASLGHDVVGMDLSAEKVAMLQRGEAPFHEPDLDDLLRQGLESGRLRFTTSVKEAVEDAAVAFICVGRPPVGQGDRSLTAVEGAVRELAEAATPGIVLVVKSTVPPGTTARIQEVVRRTRPDLDFSTVSSPEFLREGHAVEDTLRPDRLVVGSDDARGFAVLRELYAPILAAGHPMIETDPRTAELSKLASNAFLATKISFANALARVAELADADVDGVTAIMGADPRIGTAFLGAGMGFGGYCLPKDIVTLEKFAGRLGYDFGILREAVRVNEEALAAVTRKVEEAVWNLEGKKVALLGIAFKPGTDDIRGAPALALASALRQEGAVVTAFDPMAGASAADEDPELILAPDAYAAAEGADCVVICTEWSEFGALDLERLGATMRQPAIVDGRNLLDPDTVVAAGFQYFPVGRVRRGSPD